MDENYKKTKLKIPFGWQETKSDYEKNYSYYVSPSGIIYDLHPESRQLVSRVDGSTIELEEQSMEEIYCEYQELKKTLPDTVLMYGMENELYILGADGERAAETLGLPKERILINGEKVPVCEIPYQHMEIFTSMLTDRGWDLVVSELYVSEQSERYITKTKGREIPIKSWPAGRIDYLGYSGKVMETIEYTSANFEKEINDSLDCGRPIYITRYTNEEGKSFSKCPYHREELTPYIENIKRAELYAAREEQLSDEPKKSIRAQLSFYNGAMNQNHAAASKEKTRKNEERE